MTIRPIVAEDLTQIEPMALAFLQEHYAVGGDLKPTPGNAQFLAWKGVLRAVAGDPCVAAEVDGQLVGFVLWIGIDPSGLEMRDEVLQGLGTYVAPEHRRQGISKELRAEALKIARAAGYTRVDGVAFTTTAADAARASGASAAGIYVRHAITK